MFRENKCKVASAKFQTARGASYHPALMGKTAQPYLPSDWFIIWPFLVVCGIWNATTLAVFGENGLIKKLVHNMVGRLAVWNSCCRFFHGKDIDNKELQWHWTNLIDGKCLDVLGLTAKNEWIHTSNNLTC